MPTNPHSSLTCGPILNSSAETGIHEASTAHSSTKSNITLQSIVVSISRYAGERQDLLQLRVTEKSGEEVLRKGGRKQSRCPGDDDDGFPCFISVPSGKYRTAVLLKLGHDNFLAHPTHFITSYPPPCSMTYRVSQEELTKLRESVPYVELYRYNPKHLYPKLNGYGDNGQGSLKL